MADDGWGGWSATPDDVVAPPYTSGSFCGGSRGRGGGGQNRAPGRRMSTHPLTEDEVVEPSNGQVEDSTKSPYFSNPGEMVTFYIGKEESEFKVHKDFVCKHSPVLKAALSGMWEESRTLTYRLEDTTSEAFHYLSEFFYTGKIEFLFHGSDQSYMSKEDSKKEEHQGACKKDRHALVQLWILAEKLLIADVQNLVVHQLERSFQKCLVVFRGVVAAVYKDRPDDCPLRQLMVDQVAWGCTVSFYRNQAEKLPKEFYVDLATAFGSAAPAFTKEKKNSSRDLTAYYVNHESA